MHFLFGRSPAQIFRAKWPQAENISTEHRAATARRWAARVGIGKHGGENQRDLWPFVVVAASTASLSLDKMPLSQALQARRA